MNFFERIWRSNFSIKLRHWEYWPFGILQFPAILYYFWLSLRARSFFFFTASNPGIEMGGMFGESKYKVLKKIPEKYVAKSILITAGCSLPVLQQKMEDAGLSFPVVFKPDLGERGYWVKRIHHLQDAQHYLLSFKFDFIIQELIDLPLEFGVFYKRIPGNNQGRVFSITGKEMLTVVGNGMHTLEQLILAKDRSKLQWEKLRIQHASMLQSVLKKGEVFLLNPIGNHCLGTIFLNNNSLITPLLNSSFDQISHEIEGFYYGRFDLRCASISDLEQGNVKIMELNGCGAEPAHIYEPGYSFWRAVVEMLQHWYSIFEIAQVNRTNGIGFLTYKEAMVFYDRFKNAVQP